MTDATYEYTRQDAQGQSCTLNAWAKVPASLSAAERGDLKRRAAELLRAKNAVLVEIGRAHV